MSAPQGTAGGQMEVMVPVEIVGVAVVGVEVFVAVYEPAE
jgi:hypothetical protein